jgi:DNA-directed RNA polymerase subunit H (RpoH/RPB5)
MKDEYKELLKDLKITPLMLKKILQEVVTTIEKNDKTGNIYKLKNLLEII